MSRCGSVCHVLIDSEPALDMNVATFAQLLVLVCWVVTIKVKLVPVSVAEHLAQGVLYHRTTRPASTHAAIDIDISMHK